MKARFENNPVTFHIGASYLTEAPSAVYADTDCEHYLGRLETFINVLYKNSTLAKSPYMVPPKVESYDDYDADFTRSFIRIQQTQAIGRGRLIDAEVEAFRSTPDGHRGPQEHIPCSTTPRPKLDPPRPQRSQCTREQPSSTPRHSERLARR